MPIKDLGKYKRPGIFIEEIDNSLVELPIQDVLINLVPGFSKKGPINNPVYIDNTVDFETIFGTLDKQLENKGSFFHRTALQMLNSGPIWALNLLKTDATRDKLNWKSVSVSALYQNGSMKQDAYERFFNRQDFWVRDSESFMDLVNDPTPDTTRLLHLTNMGDKTITTFLFKSSVTGFDVTAENWYVGATNVPSYINPKDYISDYMVGVLVIAGDWTDYNTLSVDTTWSKYFSTTGLLKDTVEDFVNERNVTVIANYDTCLIPNFRDKDGRDMYIKNVINNDTDKTGLFCAYNEDELFGADFPEGKLDLLGNTLVGSDTSEIEFLSYKETLTEAITYSQKYLDSAGNVFAFSPDFGTVGTRTGVYTNWVTSNFEHLSDVSGVTAHTISFNSLTGAYYVLGGNKIPFATTGSTTAYDTLLDPLTTTEVKRIDHLYLTTDNTKVQVLKGYEILSATTNLPEYSVNNDDTIHLGYVTVLNTGGVTTVTYSGVTVNDSGYMPLSSTGSTSINIYESTIIATSPRITIEFLGTLGVKDLTDYQTLRYYKIFDELALNIEGGKSVIINNSSTSKYEIGSNYQISDFTTTANCKINLYVDVAANYVSIPDLLIYYVDDEFILSNSTNRAKTLLTDYPGADATYGVVAKYSTFYQNFYDGIINALDYFVVNNLAPTASGATKVYVRPFLDNNGILTVDFLGSKDQTAGLITTSTWTTGYDSKLIIWSERQNYKQTLEVELPLSSTDLTKITQVSVDKNRYSEVGKGSYLEAYVDETDPEVESGAEKPRRMTRIIRTAIDPANSNYKILYTDSPIKIEDNDLSGSTDYITTVYPSIDVYVTDYKGISLAPFKIHADSIPNGTETRQSDILSVIGVNATSSLAKGLVNKNKISWRYLVDSFGLGLIENSKQEFMALCGKKLNCLGFLNMPSARMFRKSNNPSFVNDDGSLNMEYIMQGGNENKNPSFLYSFGIGAGESCVGYFFPYVKDSANGDEKMVPPAAFIATTYMQKHISNVAGIDPWTIAAGLQNGRVSISGTEMDFTDEDLEFLYQMSANPIVRDIRSGYYINSESTAQVNPTTSLSYIHSREVLIELENDLYDMLLRYQWKFNTPSVRAEIKYRADKICKEYMDAGALYDFRNVIDETNNTSDVIDSQRGVLDTFVEIVKGMGMIINNITILGVGKISSSGFTV